MKANNQYNNPWSTADLKVLRNKKLTHQQAADKIGRTYAAVKRKRLDLNIDSAKFIDKWSKAEVFILKNHRELSNKEIGRMLGRSTQAVQLKRQRLNLLQNGYFWTEFDISFLKKNYKKYTVKELAIMMHKPVSGIATKASDLSLKKR